MINKTILLSLFLSITFFLSLSSTLNAQERNTERVWQSPNAAVSQTIGLTEIHLTYGRPSVRDRVVFAADGLAPFGQVWRTGANESTAIVFPDDVYFGGNHVTAGTYSLYTIPGEEEWTVILNGKLSWGTAYDADEDVLRFTVAPEASSHMEQMMFYFENVTTESADLVLHWATTRIAVSIAPDRVPE
ncbi:MAG: DUF2911 domain-containing protein [Balneolaceae bacterium]|nr:MAG: DUF2911 domain-containing protein [Balneolaceae bacterium]